MAEPLIAQTCRELAVGQSGGYPFLDRSDRSCALCLAPEWSWSVRVRHRDLDLPTVEVASEAAGSEAIEPLAQTSDVAALELDLGGRLKRFLQTAASQGIQAASTTDRRAQPQAGV